MNILKKKFTMNLFHSELYTAVFKLSSPVDFPGFPLETISCAAPLHITYQIIV